MSLEAGSSRESIGERESFFNALNLEMMRKWHGSYPKLRNAGPISEEEKAAQGRAVDEWTKTFQDRLEIIGDLFDTHGRDPTQTKIGDDWFGRPVEEILPILEAAVAEAARHQELPRAA